MDTSQDYIKMCYEASEIQSLHEHTVAGDFLARWFDDEVLVACPCWMVEFPVTWLLRQDQLQTMLNVGELGCGNLSFWSGRFAEFCNGEELASVSHGSMEKLWLMFVMKEKYNKTWNGKTWVKK